MDLEFLDICLSNISDAMPQKWSLDNAVDWQDKRPHKSIVCWIDVIIVLIVIMGLRKTVKTCVGCKLLLTLTAVNISPDCSLILLAQMWVHLELSLHFPDSHFTLEVLDAS